ncbi:hypothetical protein [Peribacillus muralis]|nr:hypothetical protein [Peribacillus muralis]MCK1992739.1 hypothetical protein [Peribacillus muralis]MCK2013294.1 hypothetical protein [Peribacillus muralis]
MGNEDSGIYKVWRDKGKRQMNIENISLYGITTLVMGIVLFIGRIID